MRSSLLVLSLLMLAPIAGCIVAHDHPEPPWTAGPAPTGTSPSDPTGPDASTKTAPRVPIDVDRSLVAQPGEGAGFFITTTAAGHWEIRWTCDTKLTARSCHVQLAVGAVGISGLAGQPDLSAISTDASGQLLIDTTTGATLDGVSFDLPRTTPIVISAWINGAPVPALEFFVSSGALSTAPVDPIQLVPFTGG